VKQTIVIIGAGAAGIILACHLNESKYDVHLYEKGKTIGRKLLVAGKGGFNLTHSEGMKDFISRYMPEEFIAPYIKHFTNQDLVKWLKSIGIDTFVGSSKRVFPDKTIKPAEVLAKFTEILNKKNVTIHTQHQWTGWTKNQLSFTCDRGDIMISADYTIFALGGASWSKTGSDGSWLSLFDDKGIKTTSFFPSNCGYLINWGDKFLSPNDGQPIKNIAVKSGNQYKKGELMITRYGIEGGAIYALSPTIRKDLQAIGYSKIYIDLKPQFSIEKLEKIILSKSKKSNWKTFFKQEIKLSNVQIDLLKTYSDKTIYNDSLTLSQGIKNLPLEIIGTTPINEAISTVGGISLHSVNKNLELKASPQHYVMGEMLNWDAPTGGYLLQACFSMGKYLADELNKI